VEVLCVEPHPLRYARLLELRDHFLTGAVPGTHWCAALTFLVTAVGLFG
jgi:hypothetical protein